MEYKIYRENNSCAHETVFLPIKAILSKIPNSTRLLLIRGFGPLANYADRATAACWRNSANFYGQRVLRGQRNGSPRSLFSVFQTGAATISSK
jgi:hypothetical protein